MRRTLLALVCLVAGCGSAAPAPLSEARAAEPQQAMLGWRESYPKSGERLVFGVRTLEVTKDGWSAQISIENRTRIPFRLGDGPPRSLGLLLLADGRLETLDRMTAKDGLLLREPTRIEPTPPDVLTPGETWRATISAAGALADAAYVRVSFGPLVAQGSPPKEMQPTVIWITDEFYRL